MPYAYSSAVVLGASMSGLLAARALSDHFEHITVVERDVLPDTEEARKGVPQSAHAHGLLASGYRAMDEYFPGLMDELEARGAPRGDVVGDFLWFQYGRWLDPSSEVERRLYVINLFPNAGKVPGSMLDVMDRMFELIFSNKLIKNIAMTRKVDEFIQALNEIEANLTRVTKLPGYQRLRQYKAIKNLIVIANEEPELVFGPFDFSQQSIKKRIEAGYRAAVICLARGEDPGPEVEQNSEKNREAGAKRRRRKR